MLLQALKDPIKRCKICFEEIHDDSIVNFAHKNNVLCENCYLNFRPKYINFKIGKIDALALYSYDETIKGLLYQFKGCYDVELKDVFLTRFKYVFRLKFLGYNLVTIPSYYLDDRKRGFNHIQEMFSCLNMPRLDVIRKIDNYKQSDQKKRDRKNIKKHFDGFDLHKVTGKNILIVDDVYTTGSSIKAAIDIISKGRPKKIKVLVMAKNFKK